MSEIQTFKGDSLELKMISCAEPALMITSSALDDFYELGYESSEFLLRLYDSERMPFSQRISRDVFVSFIKRALSNFPFIGNFDSYLFILYEIFGSDAEIFFIVPSPGKLEISINAVSDVTYEAIGRELLGSGTSFSYDYFTIGVSDGGDLTFRGVAGIETQYELDLLFSEVMPAGISPTISLEFFMKSVFISEEGTDINDVVTHLNDQIVFIETGG